MEGVEVCPICWRPYDGVHVKKVKFHLRYDPPEYIFACQGCNNGEYNLRHHFTKHLTRWKLKSKFFVGRYMKGKNHHRKIDFQIGKIKSLGMPTDQFAVVGSGALAVHGLRDAKDIDIIVTESLWNDLSQKYPVTKNDWGVEHLMLPYDIEILNPKESIFGNSKIVPRDEIFGHAEIHQGIRFMNLEHLKKIKKYLGRPIDLEDIKRIEGYQKNAGLLK